MRLPIIISLFLLVSCNYFDSEQEENAVARVKDVFLYASELDGLVPNNASKEDSILM